MNHKLLLVKAITLLYRESQLPSSSENSSGLVRGILNTIKDPQVNIGLDHERDVIVALKKTALKMCEMPVDYEHESTDLLQQLKVDCSEDETLYQTFVDGIDKDLTDAKTKKVTVNLQRFLHEHIREEEAQKILFEATNKVRFQRGQIHNWKQFIAETVSMLEPYQQDRESNDPAITKRVNLSNMDEVVGIYSNIQKNEEGGGILQTGWQGINRMLRGGYRRGQETVIGALQHNFKTGFSLGTFVGVALFNTPEPNPKRPDAKPMLLRISFEDDLELNFQYMYEVLMDYDGRGGEITSSKTAEEIKAMTEEEKLEFVKPIAEYVSKRMQETGWHVEMLRVNPSEWSYRSIQNKILELEAEGYEIHMCMLDYLSMIPTTGCIQGPTGTDVQDMFRRIRNFMSAKNIAIVTPHQLSTDAKQMIRDGKADFVQELPGKGYYRGCKQIDQEVDLEIFIHIEKVNGESFLTVQRGKHRIIGQTNPKDLYCVLPFSKWGITFDIGRTDTTRRKVGGGPIGSKEETPFWAPV